tara:strand:+ start:93588 stop:94592 length:1005 start_codon:yes stop_codon:yes gene_type:complete
MERLLLATDAWYPQVNGVVRTLSTVTNILARDKGLETRIVDPSQFRNFPCPVYPEIRLALTSEESIARHFQDFQPDCVHIATEGPIGKAVRKYCLRQGFPFTTSFHTRFPEYLRKIALVPTSISYRVLRGFHAPSERVLVPSDSIKQELENRGFQNVHVWGRGVDTKVFYPRHRKLDNKRPILMYVGRVSREKNLKAFLDIEFQGSKVVVGDGPLRKSLKKKYREVDFVGVKKGDELAAYYSSADVFVFPSKSDTFGLVIIEALACGTPVAAYEVPGPKDIITDKHIGRIGPDLRQSILMCLAECRREKCVEFVKQNYTWETSAQVFYDSLAKA